jgi:hypothetical protein
MAALALLVLAVAPVQANNDPHRFPFEWGAFDLTGPCAFTVHFDTQGNAFGKASTLPDGSTSIAFSGFAEGTLSNPGTGTSIHLNLSGPGTFVYGPDGSFVGQTTTGKGVLWAPNLTAFGLPSNLVATSGPTGWTSAAADNWAGYVITSMTRVPPIVMDLCAALG